LLEPPTSESTISVERMGEALIKPQKTLVDKAPIVKGTVSEDVRLLLLKALPSDVEEFKNAGWEEHVDHPTCPGHKYREGYFHAIANSYKADIDSIHPRYGHQLLRQSAPGPIFGFCEAFRRANADLFNGLREELMAFPTARALGHLLDDQMHFADLSIQVHWGDEVESWHIDAPNSFLHLALGLSGKRALHTRRLFKSGRVDQNCLVGVDDEREVMWQNEGGAYLASPCCFPHAVEYPSCDWENRVVAVQMRLLLTEDELFGLLDMDPHGGTAAIVFRHLAAKCSEGLRMPSLEEVECVLAE